MHEGGTVLHITPDERHVLRLLAAKQPRARLAAHLGITGFELEVQLRTLFARMGAASAADAVTIAARRGLLSLAGDAESEIRQRHEAPAFQT
jgi:DNA-binding CsgD family transcriptional regulator